MRFVPLQTEQVDNAYVLCKSCWQQSVNIRSLTTNVSEQSDEQEMQQKPWMMTVDSSLLKQI